MGMQMQCGHGWGRCFRGLASSCVVVPGVFSMCLAGTLLTASSSSSPRCTGQLATSSTWWAGMSTVEGGSNNGECVGGGHVFPDAEHLPACRFEQAGLLTVALGIPP